MGSMSASDAAPLPRLGEVFFDVRGSSRSMRLSWYSDTGVAVFSIWQGGTCTGTFRLPIDDLPRMVEALQRGPRGAALPAGDSRDPGERQRRGLTGAPTDAMPAVASFPDYATGQHIAPVTGEFRSPGPAAPPDRDDPLGSGGYPAYRERDRGQDSPGAPFPGYADDGPPVYRDSNPPPAYRDDPLGAGGYREDSLGSGGYREESLPGQRDSAPSYAAPAYQDDPLGPGGYRAERPLSYRDRDEQYLPSYRDEPGSYPGEARGPRYADDPFQSVYPDGSREPGYPDDTRTSSHPYGPPPDRPELRAPRGRS